MPEARRRMRVDGELGDFSRRQFGNSRRSDARVDKNGEMIDLMHIKLANKLLERAASIGGKS
jgi:hypothetical protein